jgi:hypothetical protein
MMTRFFQSSAGAKPASPVDAERDLPDPVEPSAPADEPPSVPPPDPLAELKTLIRRSAKISRRCRALSEQLQPQAAMGNSHDNGLPSADLQRLLSGWEAQAQQWDQRLAAIEAAVQSGKERPADEADPVKRFVEKLERAASELDSRAQKRQAALLAELQQLRQIVAPAPAAAAPTGVTDEWRHALLGDALAGDGSLAAHWDRLCTALLEGDSAAATLIGQLLIYRHAPAERRPLLLSALGEAFYRCRPKTEDVDDPLEAALSVWLQKTCEQAGFSNTIELVHPGERFDSSRHSPVRPGGIEVDQVLGWVVLKDRDKVYMKAQVSLR